jgi:hypothetical protein
MSPLKTKGIGIGASLALALSVLILGFSLNPSNTSNHATADPPDRATDRGVPPVLTGSIMPDRSHNPERQADKKARLSAAETELLEGLRQLASSSDTILPAMVSDGVMQWNPALTPEIAQLLSEMGGPAATEALVAQLGMLPDGELKEAVGQILDELDAREYRPMLLQALFESSDPGVMRSAQTALSRTADEDFIYELAFLALETQSDHQRDVTLALIASTGNRDAVPALVFLADSMAEDLEAPLAIAAIQGLASTGAPEAVSFLLSSLDMATPENATPYLDALLSVSSPEAMPVLESAALGNKEASMSATRAAAVRAMVNSPTDGTVALLQELLADADSEVAAASHRALVMLGVLNEDDPPPSDQARDG